MFSFRKKPAADPRPVALHRIGMDMIYWRTRPDLIKFARTLFATHEGQAMLSVLHAELPKGYTPNPSIQLGRMNGWIECLRCLESMGDLPFGGEVELEATFGAEKEFPPEQPNE